MPRKNNRKPRNEYIGGTTATEVSSIEVVYDPKTDSLRFGGDMVNTYSEVSYEREKNDKILSWIPQPNNDFQQNQDRALTENYDFLCAVDTNTRIIDSKRVSAAVMVLIESIFVSDMQVLREAWQFSSFLCFEFVEIKEKPENLGWTAAIEELAKSGILDNKERIGLIVDSESR
ncbi:hypothetical protein ACQ0MK_15100 [Thalassospira lucentensis]|uniref:hypothetical protein n=1 Tax=Thalassospira lucentensis TaxID=168935 RepID=UPI003D2EDA4C